MRKISPHILISILFVCICEAQGFGIRAAIGQYASQAEQIDGKTGNSFLLAVNLEPKKTFRIDIGVRYNGVRESSVNLPLLTTSFLEIESIKQKIGYTGVYVAPGLNVDLTQIGSGMEAYIIGGGGLGFSTVVTKVDFTDTTTTPLYKVEYFKSRDYWKPFWLIGGGIKIQIFYFGIFGEVAYYDGEEVEYNPLTIYGEEISPGGNISPRGFAAYLGISWN